MILLLLATSLAAASPADSPWSLAVGLGAELPVSTGAQVTLEAPGRLRLGASVGRPPGLLVYGASEASTAWGLLDADGAQLLDAGLGSALVLGGSVGWRPFREAGLWFTGDLRNLRCSTSASPELVATALGVEPEAQATVQGARSDDPELVSDPYTFAMRVTLVGGSVGWDWVLAERVVVRFSAGGLALQSGRSTLEPGDDTSSGQQLVADQANEGLESLFTGRFFTPTLGLGLGWRFG